LSEINLPDKYIEFKLTDLPTNEFCVLLEPEIQRKVIEEAASKFGSWGSITKLAKYLKTNCKSFVNVKFESINDVYIPAWKTNKRFLPIDCLLELCELAGRNVEEMKKLVIMIKEINGRNENSLPFNFVYDENIASLGELIKCEGHIKKSLNQLIFTNESIDFIRYFKQILNKIGLPKRNIYEDLKIEVEVPKESDVLEVTNKHRKLNYYIKINKASKKKVCFTDNFEYKSKKEYTITTTKKIIRIEIEIFDQKIIAKNNYNNNVSATIQVTITNSTLCKILHTLTGVQPGKKSNIITICPLAKQSPISVKIEMVNVIMASEAWLEKNRIRIYLSSIEYIKNLNDLLKDFKINPSLSKNFKCLSINKWSDLERFYKIFDMIISEKMDILKKILTNKKWFKHGEGLDEALSFLKYKHIVTAKELSIHLNKHVDTCRSHLKNGIRNGLIEKHNDSWPHKFSLTTRGEMYFK
jgi:hypothetical protein